MVDAEDAVLGKGGGDRVVDRAARGEIGAERLFQADPHVVAGQAAAPASPAMVGSNRLGAVDRKIARPCAGVPTFCASASKPSCWNVASSGW